MATLAGIGNRRIDLEGMAEADGRNCGLKYVSTFSLVNDVIYLSQAAP